MLQSEAMQALEEAKTYSDRLVRLGSSAFDQGGFTYVDVKPQPWGQYIALMEDTKITDIQWEEIKYKLTESIVKGLIEKKLVQFIFKDSDVPFAPQTIGAKLFVIPWEQTVNGGVIRERKAGSKSSGCEDR